MNIMDETTINDRIKEIIYHYKLNNSRLSKMIGLKSSTTINNIVSGRRSKPSYEVLRKIAEHFPVNPAWLLLGKGPMLLDSEDNLDMEEVEVDKIANAILRSPEKFEKNPLFAKYLEAERSKAITEHYADLMKSRMPDIDLSDIKPKTETD